VVCCSEKEGKLLYVVLKCGANTVQYSFSQFLLTLLDLCLCVCSVPLVTFVSAVHNVKTKKGCSTAL